MAKSTFGSPVFTLAPGEAADLRARAAQSPVFDADTQDLIDSPYGSTLIGARNTLTGGAGWRLGMFIENTIESTNNWFAGREEAPLNLSIKKDQLDPISDDISFFMENNPETISQEIQDIPFDEIPWILSSPSHRVYKQRLQFIKAAQPEVQEQGSGLAKAGYFIADIAGLTATSMAAEPLVLARLNIAGMAGRAAAASTGRYGVQATTAATAEAVAAVSRLNITSRYAALGVGESVAYHLARQNIDPAFDPTAGDMAFDMALGGVLTGAIGGAWLGRRYVANAIDEAAENIRRNRETVVQGLNGETYTIRYGDPFAFSSPVHADTVLFAPGSGTFAWEAGQVGRALWQDFAETGDLFIPGTKTTQDLFILGGTFPSGTAGRGGVIRNFPPFDDVVPARAPDSPSRLSSAFEIPNDRAWRPPLVELSRYSENLHLGFDDVNGLNALFATGAPAANWRIPVYLSEQAGSRIRVQFTAGDNIVGRVVGNPNRQQYSTGQFAFESPNSPASIRNGIQSIRVNLLGRNADEVVNIRNLMNEKGFREVASSTAEDLTFIPRNASFKGRPPLTTTGVRSVIKVIANEMKQSGVELTEDIFERIAQVVARAERTKLAGDAFSKQLWTEVSAEFSELANIDRMTGRIIDGTVPKIGGIDSTLQDVAARADLVDSVWTFFRDDSWRGYREQGESLIFQVLDEIKTRGGKVDRKVVGEVIDELRTVSQNPPKRLNARGARTLDTGARKQAVIEIINKRVPSNSGKIYIPPSLMKRLAPNTAAVQAAAASAAFRQAGAARGGAGGGGGGGGTGGGGAAPRAAGGAMDASDAPRNYIRLPGWNRVGNQAALAHESENGWARLAANLMFFARRDMGAAQRWTEFERGSFFLYGLFSAFSRGYRNGYIRFALGDGNTNVLRKIGLTDVLATTFKGRALRNEFHERVAKQMRSGLFNDPVDVVNDTARGMQQLLRSMYKEAHEAGVRGFESTAVNNYFPRLWRHDRIRTLGTTAQGRQTLKDLMRNLLDQNGRKVIIDGTEHTITTDLDDAAEALTSRLLKIANEQENAPLTIQDQDLFDAISNLDGPIKQATQSRTPFGRARVLFNETASAAWVQNMDALKLGRSGLTLEDITHTDLPYVMRKYGTSVMGAVNERRILTAINDQLAARGVMKPLQAGKPPEAVRVDTINEAIDLFNTLAPQMKSSEQEALRELFAALRYEPLHHGKTRLRDKAASWLTTYGYLIRSGAFGFAQITEINRIVGTYGFKQTVRQMPVLKEMFSNWKSLDEGPQNFATAIDMMFNPASERLRRVITRGFENMAPYDVGESRALNYLKRSSEFASDISGLAPATSFTQQLAAATTLQHFWEVSKGLAKEMDESTIRLLGLTKQEYDDVVRYVGQNATTRKILGQDRVTDLANTDVIEMHNLIAFVDRVVRTRIQDVPTRGDFHKEMFGVTARLITQFRTFNLKGIDNFLLANASRMAYGNTQTRVRVLSEIGFTAVAAGLVHWGRNKIAYETARAARDYDKMEEIEKRMTPSGITRGALTGPSEFFLPGMITDTVAQYGFGSDPIFSPYRYSGLSLYGFPSFAMTSNALSVGNDLLGYARGDRSITQGTIYKAQMLLPGSTLPGLSSYYEIKAADIVDEFDLPKVQPKYRDSW